MACNKPLYGWLSVRGGFTMSSGDAYLTQRMSVPCGQCMGCRLARTSEWATRIMKEAGEYEENTFLSLTYDDKHIREDLSLHLPDLQKFIKRLRYDIWQDEKKRGVRKKDAKKIRYYACGEYGNIDEVRDPYEKIKYVNKYGSTKLARPHYHIIIFNYWPEDCQEIKETDYGAWYESEKMEELWGKGFTSVGQVSFESAAYTASYVTKKINGDETRFHYKGREQEFAVMSRGGKDSKGKLGGVGARYYQKYADEIWANNSIIVRGHKVVPPRYFKNKLKEKDWEKSIDIKMANIRPYVSQDRMADIETFMRKKQEFFRKDKI